MVNKPLFEKLQDLRHKWNNEEFSEETKRYRLALVQIYDRVRGVDH
jgi:Mor family transcriptional regulator